MEWEQVQAPGVEIRRKGTQGKLREGKDGNRGDYAALPMRCACDRAKSDGQQWVWGAFIPWWWKRETEMLLDRWRDEAKKE